jgi:hypothetical protein
LEDGVGNDVKALGEKNWKNLAGNRKIWQNVVRKVMTPEGLCFQL